MKKGILKSDKLFNISSKALIVEIGAAALAFVSLIPFSIVSAVYGAPVEDLRNETKTSPTYIQYVQDKTSEYNEDLSLGEISPKEYMAKINDLGDIDAYLKSDAPKYEMARYSELVESSTKAKWTAGGVTLGFCGVGALAAIVGLTSLGLSNKAEKRVEEEAEQDSTI